MGLIEILGAYCADLSYADLPAPVVETAKVKLLDALACAIASEGTETRDVAFRYADRLPDGHASLFGAGLRRSPTDAAFVNGVLTHALLQDDADAESGHPDCMIAPAAAAAAEEGGTSGERLLLGIVLGYEMMWRGGGRGRVLNGSLNRGIRGYVLNGGIGAAAAASAALGLTTAAQFSHAMSCGATFSAGLLEPIGVASIERSMMAGANARSGVEAALLAAAGLRGTAKILEGGNGYFRAMADIMDDVPGVTADLGKSHRIMEAATKLYPSGIANQAAIFAARQIRQEHGITPEQIAAVRIRQFPLFGNGVPAYPSVISQGPYSEVEEALPNKPFAVAAMFKNGAFDIHILKAQLRDPVIAALAKKVTSVGVEGFAALECEMDVELVDDRHLTAHVNESGGAGFFPDLAQMSERFHWMADRYVGPAPIDALVACVRALDTPDGLRSLTALLRGLPRGATAQH